ncbi:hypothetical protein [Burkholderia ubonensis]|uniref:hypothetical protein n=1 Tax=Burkholderia ubonensis TaxID=101571 RepID=UPI000AD45D2E|nr:hypothetical protein [Burkholderia ubonensis]
MPTLTIAWRPNWRPPCPDVPLAMLEAVFEDERRTQAAGFYERDARHDRFHTEFD